MNVKPRLSTKTRPCSQQNRASHCFTDVLTLFDAEDNSSTGQVTNTPINYTVVIAKQQLNYIITVGVG